MPKPPTRMPRRVKKWRHADHPNPRYERLIWRWWVRVPLDVLVKKEIALYGEH